MIVLLFKLILITSLLVLGYTIVTQENMLLHSVRRWAERIQDRGSKFIETLAICHWCMPSTWSLLGFAFGYGLGLYDLSWKLLLLYPLCVAGSSLTCGIIWGLNKLIESATQYFTNGEKLIYMDIRDRKDRYNAKRKNNGN